MSNDRFWRLVHAHLDARRDPLLDPELQRHCADDPAAAAELLRLLALLPDVPSRSAPRRRWPLAAAAALAAALLILLWSELSTTPQHQVWTPETPRAPTEDDVATGTGITPETSPLPRVLAWSVELRNDDGVLLRRVHRDARGATRRTTPSPRGPHSPLRATPNGNDLPRVLDFSASATTVHTTTEL